MGLKYRAVTTVGLKKKFSLKQNNKRKYSAALISISNPRWNCEWHGGLKGAMFCSHLSSVLSEVRNNLAECGRIFSCKQQRGLCVLDYSFSFFYCNIFKAYYLFSMDVYNFYQSISWIFIWNINNLWTVVCFCKYSI